MEVELQVSPSFLRRRSKTEVGDIKPICAGHRTSLWHLCKRQLCKSQAPVLKMPHLTTLMLQDEGPIKAKDKQLDNKDMLHAYCDGRKPQMQGH